MVMLPQRALRGHKELPSKSEVGELDEELGYCQRCAKRCVVLMRSKYETV